MKKYKIIFMAVLYSALLSLGSCIPEGEDTVGEAGSSFVKFYPAEYTVVALDAIDESQTGILLEIRRDVKSESALNSSASVTLKFDEDGSMIDAYNEKHEDVFIPLPSNFYTLSPAVSGGQMTVNFAPGEFAKSINITIPNALLFDFSEKYALAFKLESVTGEGVKSMASSDTILAQVMVKNKWDGKYEVTAITPMLDVANATLTGYYPFMYHLETTGANTCMAYDMTVWFAPFHPILSGTAVSGYGSFGLELEFDPETGEIVAVYNPYGNPPSNTRMPVIDPSGVNKWDEETGDIQFKYWMIQPSVITSPPHIRVYFDEYWAYKGPR